MMSMMSMFTGGAQTRDKSLVQVSFSVKYDSAGVEGKMCVYGSNECLGAAPPCMGKVDASLAG